MKAITKKQIIVYINKLIHICPNNRKIHFINECPANKKVIEGFLKRYKLKQWQPEF